MSNPAFTALNDQAKIIVSKGEWQLALEKYLDILKLKNLSASEKSIIHSNISLMYLNLNKSGEALSEALSAITENPEWFKGYLRAGDAMFKMNCPGPSLQMYRSGLAIENDETLRKKCAHVSEIYFTKFYKTRLSPSVAKNELWENFKKYFFVHYEKAKKIYLEIQDRRELFQNQDLELESLHHEMHQLFLDNFQIEEWVENLKSGFIYEGTLLMWKYSLRKHGKDGDVDRIVSIFKENNSKNPRFAISNLLKNPLNHTGDFSIEFNKIIDILWPNIYESLHSFSYNSSHYYLEDVQNDENDWFINISETSRTAENFYPKGGPEKSKHYFWKFFTMNNCFLLNSCLAMVVHELIESKIIPFFKYIDPLTKNEERINIFCPSLSELIVTKEFKSPWINYKTINCWFKMLRGRKIRKPIPLNMDDGHTVAFFLTEKKIKNQNLLYLVDLTGFQYDFLDMTDAGFPYFEEKVLSGEYFNKNFIFQNNARPIINVTFREDVIGSYPAFIWNSIKETTVKGIKMFVKNE